jgi:hypothetical protein
VAFVFSRRIECSCDEDIAFRLLNFHQQPEHSRNCFLETCRYATSLQDGTPIIRPHRNIQISPK